VCHSRNTLTDRHTSLSERNRQICERYLNGETPEEIAQDFGLSHRVFADYSLLALNPDKKTVTISTEIALRRGDLFMYSRWSNVASTGVVEFRMLPEAMGEQSMR
jgi:hypothetical protein